MELKKLVGKSELKVIKYEFPADSLWDVVLGSARANDPAAQWQSLLELTVPRAMYYFSAGLPAPRGD